MGFIYSGCDLVQFGLVEIRVIRGILRNCGGRGRNLNCNERKVGDMYLLLNSWALVVSLVIKLGCMVAFINLLNAMTEKARLQAEAKAAEDARRQAEAEAAAEAKRKRELEREAARQALLQVSCHILCCRDTKDHSYMNYLDFC